MGYNHEKRKAALREHKIKNFIWSYTFRQKLDKDFT
jgi:hypothetical protein